MNEKLNQKWINKIQVGENINITDLYEFSKVNLKRSRMRKKFNKHYYKYISNKIAETYMGICVASPLVNGFKKMMDFDLKIEPMLELPKGKIIYMNYQY